MLEQNPAIHLETLGKETILLWQTAVSEDSLSRAFKQVYNFTTPILFHIFSKVSKVVLVEGKTAVSVNSLVKWCKLDNAGDVLCQEARLTFRRCKIPAPCQISVMPH